MPVQKRQTSGLLGKYRDKIKEGHEQHKGEETEYKSFGDLPEGIEDGIAELRECKFDVHKDGDNKGETYFTIVGIVCEPKTHTYTDEHKVTRTVKTEGKRFSVIEPLYDTPKRTRKTTQDHIGKIYDYLRRLGVNTKEIDEDSLEETANSLADKSNGTIYFTFRTWRGKPATTGEYAGKEPMLQQTLVKWCDYTPAEDAATSDVNDGSKTVEQPKAKATNGHVPTATAPKPTGKPTTTKKPLPPVDEELPTDTDPDAEAEAAAEGETDLETLIQLADAQDQTSMDMLKKMAMDAGVEEADVDNANNWTEVVELMQAAMEGTSGSEPEEEPTGVDQEQEEEEQEYVWKTDDVCLYKPLDPKTKKPFKDTKDPKKDRKPVECTVTGVDKKGKTVNLKNLDNPKLTYLKIAWSDLITIE